jgi:drug/metabolite transporter (DMT)-like permease
LLGWLWLKGARPNWQVAVGLLIGFIGVYLLIGGNTVEGGTNYLFGAGLVMTAAFCWALGSMYGVRATTPKSSLLTSGMQMLSGGSVLLLVGTFAGEWTKFNIADASINSWLGFTYLIVFGSIVGFTAYSWLLKNAAPSLVSTYAYVNPVVAVLLGWLIAGESLSLQMLVGAAVIIGSVALITSTKESKKAEESEIETSQCPSFSTSS